MSVDLVGEICDIPLHHLLDGWETLFVAPNGSPSLNREYMGNIKGIYIGNIDVTGSKSLPPNHWIATLYDL